MLRIANLILMMFFGLTASVYADVTSSELVYDPSVCQAQGESDDPIEAAVQAAQSAECLAMMAAFPRPELERIPADESTLRRSYWRLNTGGTNLYDAPGGQVIGNIPAGFNFIQATEAVVDGWVQRDGGEWIRSSAGKPERVSNFVGFADCRKIGSIPSPSSWTRRGTSLLCDQTKEALMRVASLRGGTGLSISSPVWRPPGAVCGIWWDRNNGYGKSWWRCSPRRGSRRM